MEQSHHAGAAPQENPFGSYAAYACRAPSRAAADAARPKHTRLFLAVGYAVLAASLLTTSAHAAALVFG